MLFNSFQFALFFAIVFPLYCVFSHRWQNALLLVASYYFYACWDWRFLGLMLFTTVADYFMGLKIEDSTDEKVRKRWLVASVVMNLVILGFFKYFNFFVDSAQRLLMSLGIETHPWTLQIILPVGISFYTFHEISYITDVYRKHIRAARRFFDFALFISFFPQLVAGPIGRASFQLPQMENPRKMTWEKWCEGLALFMVGLFKKLCIADVLAPMADRAFSDPYTCSPGALAAGLFAFSFQIYADFSGYSDMARGLARAMGFELIENFNQPYFAASITEFWRRWHISLSTWLRDYLYIPLGGNRLGEWKTYRNLFLTMFLGGLWHGANWTFAIWGAMHGIYLAAHKLILGKRKPDEIPQKDGVAGFAIYLGKVVGTFLLVALTWVFFRAQDFATAFAFLKGLNPARGGKELYRFDSEEVTYMFLAVGTLVFLIDIPQYWRRDHCALLRWPTLRRVAAFSVITIWILMMRGIENVPFIYFQF